MLMHWRQCAVQVHPRALATPRAVQIEAIRPSPGYYAVRDSVSALAESNKPFAKPLAGEGLRAVNPESMCADRCGRVPYFSGPRVYAQPQTPCSWFATLSQLMGYLARDLSVAVAGEYKRTLATRV